jgi:plastocyanin
MLRRSLSVALTVGTITAMSALATTTPSEASHRGQAIKIVDDCQPKSFNAVLGRGACIGHGETTFNDFIAELTATKIAQDWHFDPSMLKIHKGRPVILKNEGGETHTFTLVKAFGGGFVDQLNQLLGNPVPAKECAVRLPDGSLAPQPPSPLNVFLDAQKEYAFRTAGLKRGKYRFECCIHPWMRVILTVR